MGTNSTVANLTITSVLSFLLNFTNFMTTRTTSPLTLTIAGNVKGVVTIILSVALFNTPLLFWNVIGIVTTILGAAWYSYLSYAEKHQKRSADAEASPSEMKGATEMSKDV